MAGSKRTEPQNIRFRECFDPRPRCVPAVAGGGPCLPKDYTGRPLRKLAPPPFHAMLGRGEAL